MHIPTQKEIWDEKRAKLQFYRQARETPLGYVPNKKPTPKKSVQGDDATKDLPITFLSERDLRTVSNKFAHYVFKRKEDITDTTRERYKNYLNIGKTVNKKEQIKKNAQERQEKLAKMKQENELRQISNTSLSNKSNKSMKYNKLEDQKAFAQQYGMFDPHQRRNVESNSSFISQWRIETSFTNDFEGDDIPITSMYMNHSNIYQQQLSRKRPHTAHTAHTLSQKKRAVSAKRPQTSRVRKSKLNASLREPQNSVTKSQVSRSRPTTAISNISQGGRPVFIAVSGRPIRNDLMTDNILDNLETSQDASLLDSFREVPSFSRRVIYDEAIRKAHAKKLRRKHSSTKSSHKSLNNETLKLDLESIIQDLEHKAPSSPVMVSSVKMYDPNSVEEDDEIYYGEKTLVEKVKSGKWKNHEPSQLPTYDTPELRKMKNRIIRENEAKRLKAQHEAKDSTSYKQIYHQYLENKAKFGEAVDVSIFGAESFVNLDLLNHEMTFNELRSLLLDLYCEMRVPFSKGDEVIEQHFDVDVPKSRKAIINEINSLIVIRSQLLQIIEEIRKFKLQAQYLEQNKITLKKSEYERRELNLKDSSNSIIDMIRKWKLVADEFYPWKEFIYRGENLLQTLPLT